MFMKSNVAIDPIWLQHAEEAKNRHPHLIARSRKLDFRARLGTSKIANRQAEIADMIKRRRNKISTDIIESHEHEIPMKEKILLIVSRSLNDRLSLTGYVYGWLIRECKARAVRNEGKEEIIEDKFHDNDDEIYPSKTALSITRSQRNPRERRQDVHGVLKYITKTLFEIRPGLFAAPRYARLAVVAVESLVFGELYDLVFDEIEEEMREKDITLMQKISEFEMNHYFKMSRKQKTSSTSATSVGVEKTQAYPITDEKISVKALKALLSIPEARTPVDKLAFCVSFVEEISAHFSNILTRGGGDNTAEVSKTETKRAEEKDERQKNIPIMSKRKKSGAKVLCTDSLLKMVCEHIIVAKVPGLNAELSFLEEFERDEQLLLGKEGYSLATLQASLYFLNASTDFDEDIFSSED